jgi:hypothetical protein
LKARLKQFLFGLLGKDPEAIVVSFATGDPAAAERMFEEVRQLEPQRRHSLASAIRDLSHRTCAGAVYR